MDLIKIIFKRRNITLSKKIIIFYSLITFVTILIVNYYTRVNFQNLSTKINSTAVSIVVPKNALNCSAYKRNVKVKNKIYNLVYDRVEVTCDKEEFHFYLREQIKLSEKFLINKPNYCGNDKGMFSNLIVIVVSDIKESNQRTLIRELWGKSIRVDGYKLLFFVAKSNNESLQQNLLNEDRKEADIIQAAFDEDYYNETLKFFAVFHWIKRHCEHVRFVVKVDEDMVVDVNELLTVIKNHENERKIMLGPAVVTNVVRKAESKHFMPEFIYKNNEYPKFVSGSILIFTGDCVSQILQEAKRITPFYLDDVYFIAFVAPKAGVKVSYIEWNGYGPHSVAYHSYRGDSFREMSAKVTNNRKR